jgi:hypothetical protein
MNLSTNETRDLEAACKRLAPGPDYRMDDYIHNLIITVLDFQLNVQVVNSAFARFRKRHQFKRVGKLRTLLAQYPNSKKGNLALSQELWGYNLWTRAKFLRMIVEEFDSRSIKGQESLVRWLKRVKFDREIKGQFRTKEHSMGLAIFSWLQLRCGLPTVKPDVHVLNFVRQSIGRKVSPEIARQALNLIAKRLKVPPYRLDAAIWHLMRDV